MGESILGISQILSQLTSFSFQVKDRMKDKEKIKEKTSGVSNVDQKAMKRRTILYSINTWPLEP
jgi:hypothetical protein